MATLPVTMKGTVIGRNNLVGRPPVDPGALLLTFAIILALLPILAALSLVVLLCSSPVLLGLGALVLRSRAPATNMVLEMYLDITTPLPIARLHAILVRNTGDMPDLGDEVEVQGQMLSNGSYYVGRLNILGPGYPRTIIGKARIPLFVPAIVMGIGLIAWLYVFQVYFVR